jgi:hypothetical protein
MSPPLQADGTAQIIAPPAAWWDLAAFLLQAECVDARYGFLEALAQRQEAAQSLGGDTALITESETMLPTAVRCRCVAIDTRELFAALP